MTVHFYKVSGPVLGSYLLSMPPTLVTGDTQTLLFPAPYWGLIYYQMD